MTDRDQLRKALEDIAEWLDGFATLDLDEIAADNGITVGMVCQQEARWRATKCRRAALATPDQAVMAERERLREALQAHHDWHLAQTDEDEHGIILAEAYIESALYDQTIAALATSGQAMTAKRKDVPVPQEVADALEDYNSLLRSAYQVANREGKQTRWDTFTARLKKILDQHHSTWLRYSSFQQRQAAAIRAQGEPK